MDGFKAPFLRPDAICDEAARFLRVHHPSREAPIPIEEIAELKLGIDIIPIPGLKDVTDAEAFINSDFTEIRVDQFIFEKRLNRYRFSLAHEVGHMVLHREIIQDFRFSTIDEWKAVVNSIPPKEYGWLEYHAYVFAGFLLVPVDQLALHFGSAMDHLIAVGYEPDRRSPVIRRPIEAELAKRFVVSADVIHRRLEAEGMWAAQ